MPPREVQDSLAALARHYEIQPEQDLDRGANGYMYFARNRVSEQEVAIKFYAGEPGDGRHDEPRLLAQVRSPNVLSIFEARAVSDMWAYFITPRCEGDLDDFLLTHPSAHKAIDLSLGICSGASAIHASGMLHRDLKPANIVVQHGVPLIADFGSVRLLPAGSRTVVASRHSVLYRPPESFDSGTYSLQGDLYQLGLVTYQLLGGALPYDEDSYLSQRDRRELDGIVDSVDRCLFVDQVFRRRALDGSLVNFASLPPWVTRRTRRTLKQMIAPNPADRFTTLAEAAAALTWCRQDLKDWQVHNSGAKLHVGDRIIELRPTETAGQFAAFLVRPDGSRRVPGVAAGSLASLVDRF